MLSLLMAAAAMGSGLSLREITENRSLVMEHPALFALTFLSLIAIVPSIIFSFTGNHLIQAFGGTSILIMVGVVLDTFRQLESQMMMRHYKGFLE